MKRQNGKEPCVQKIFGIIIAAGDVLINFTVISPKFATLDNEENINKDDNKCQNDWQKWANR